MSLFSTVKGVRKRANKFNLSHDTMLACEMGQIVPCYVQENILPNSHLKINTYQLQRFQALLAPLQHSVNAYVHFWWIPQRLVDKKFPDFISGQMVRTGETYDPPYFTYANLADFVGPYITDYVKNGGLLDFLGYPIPKGEVDWSKLTTKMSIRRLQYYLLPIYYKYINENIAFDATDMLDVIKQFCGWTISGIDLTGDVSDEVGHLLEDLYTMNYSMCFPHAWQKDYFTSALPFVQLGEEVVLPVGGSAPVTIESGQDVNLVNQDGYNAIQTQIVGHPDGVLIGADGSLQATNNSEIIPITPITHLETSLSNELVGEADLSEATAITINELRLANALQSLKEAFARFGTRYNEYLEGFFGQHPDDQTLQMPLWLGGGKVPMHISDIDQKSATSNDSVTGSTTPLGTVAGKGIGFGTFKSVNAHFKEMGCVIGYLFIQPKSLYGNQGLNRFITKLDNLYDFFNPKMEHLGEQAVLNQEIFYSDDEQNDGTFGYQSRFAEYKFMASEVHGQFMNVLNFWHMARIFDNRPTLSEKFIYTQLAEMKRPFAVQHIEDEDGNPVDISSVLCWLHFDVQYVARMSRFGTPMLLN